MLPIWHATVLGMATDKQLSDTVPESDWISPWDASKALGISQRTVARLADRGDIRAIRPTGGHRRYYAPDIEAIIAGEPWDKP